MATAKPAKKAIIAMDVLGVDMPIGEVKDFEINTARGTIDASTMGTDWKKYLTGQANWTASMTMFYDPSDGGQEALVDKMIDGTLCDFTFLPFGSDEVYLLFLDTPLRGNFALGYDDDHKTDALPFDATAADIQAELRYLYNTNAIFVVDDADFLILFPTGVTANLQIFDNNLEKGTVESPEDCNATCTLQPVPAQYDGSGRVTGWNPSGATEDAVGLSLSIQGNGELEKVV